MDDCNHQETSSNAKIANLRGQKRPLLPKEVWSIRARLEMNDAA